MKQKDLAKRLGLSQAMVSRLVKRGMPTSVNAGQDPTLFAGEVAALFSARCGRGPAAVRA